MSSACHTRSLSSRLEVAIDKGRHIVLIGVTTGGSAGLAETALVDDVLEEAVLLGSDLLEDIWEQLLHVLGLGLSNDGEEVLAHRVLNCDEADK